MESKTQAVPYEILLSSCAAYSDLWDINVKLLNRNFADHPQTWLLTDTSTDRSFPGVELLAAGAGTQIGERIRFALQKVRAEYVLLLLDDYYLTHPIRNAKLEAAVSVMEREGLDYLELYPVSKLFLKKDGSVPIPGADGFYRKDLSSGSYKVNLTPGMWKRSFLEKTLKDGLSVWEYEVSLTGSARKLGAKVGVSCNMEVPYLDVIRKGKLLRRANRYLRKNHLALPERKLLPISAGVSLAVKGFAKKALPQRLFRSLKKQMIRKGHSFYSPIE